MVDRVDLGYPSVNRDGIPGHHGLDELEIDRSCPAEYVQTDKARHQFATVTHRDTAGRKRLLQAGIAFCSGGVGVQVHLVSSAFPAGEPDHLLQRHVLDQRRKLGSHFDFRSGYAHFSPTFLVRRSWCTVITSIFRPSSSIAVVSSTTYGTSPRRYLSTTRSVR